MRKESRAFLEQLLNTPSPTGFEREIQKIVKGYASKFADAIEGDAHGNQIFSINRTAPLRVMLAGHCDQIALIVKHITADGFLYVAPLGGIDVGVLPGSLLTVHTAKENLPAVVGRKPIHLQKNEERGKVNGELKDIWLDIGVKNKKEAEKLVRIGDPVTFKLGTTTLRGGDLLVSPGLDDKSGLFVVIEALRLASERKINVAMFSVSTVQEEVGLRGAKTAAYGIDPHVGIAVDVTHASDNPGKEDDKMVPCKLGAGPAIYRGPNISPLVEEQLIAVAKKKKIPYQLLPSVAPLGNDANVIQVNKSGVAAASIGIANRYMHTQGEIVSLTDLEQSAELLAAFVASLTAKSSFVL